MPKIFYVIYTYKLFYPLLIGDTVGWGHYTHHLHDLCITQVDTELCEQLFSTLSCYARIAQHMKREHFLFYLLLLM